MGPAWIILPATIRSFLFDPSGPCEHKQSDAAIETVGQAQVPNLMETLVVELPSHLLPALVSYVCPVGSNMDPIFYRHSVLMGNPVGPRILM